jgi:hypothetical protein
MNNRYKGPYIDASYQVSVHWAKPKGFQRRRLKCEKFKDGRRRTDDGSSDGNGSGCLWQGELKSFDEYVYQGDNTNLGLILPEPECQVANFHGQASDAYVRMMKGSLFSWITL